MTAKKGSKLSDPDMQAVPAALARAAQAARELARLTATPLVIAEKGQVVLLPAAPEKKGRRQPKTTK